MVWRIRSADRLFSVVCAGANIGFLLGTVGPSAVWKKGPPDRDGEHREQANENGTFLWWAWPHVD